MGVEVEEQAPADQATRPRAARDETFIEDLWVEHGCRSGRGVDEPEAWDVVTFALAPATVHVRRATGSPREPRATTRGRLE